MLRLQSPVTAMPGAPIVSASQADTALTPGIDLTIAGYGEREQEDQYGQLYVATTPYQRRNARELIAGSKGKPDTCFGDSGGPVYLLVHL